MLPLTKPSPASGSGSGSGSGSEANGGDTHPPVATSSSAALESYQKRTRNQSQAQQTFRERISSQIQQAPWFEKFMLSGKPLVASFGLLVVLALNLKRRGGGGGEKRQRPAENGHVNGNDDVASEQEHEQVTIPEVYQKWTEQRENGDADVTHVAVVTGGHPFDVVGFANLWRGLMPSVDAYVQHMDDFCSAPQEVRDAYDVIVFYNFNLDAPKGRHSAWWHGDQAQMVENLGLKPYQGIFVMHHAYHNHHRGDEFTAWNEVLGVKSNDERKTDYKPRFDQKYKLAVADPMHPITRSAGDSFWLVDETYNGMPQTLDRKCHVILKSDYEHQVPVVAWTHSYRQSRVFVLLCGHNNSAWSNRHIVKIIKNGVLWCARKEADIAQKSPKSSPYKANGFAPSYGSPLRVR